MLNKITALCDLFQEIVDGILEILDLIGKKSGILEEGEGFRHCTDQLNELDFYFDLI